jgi:hypothetical protein
VQEGDEIRSIDGLRMDLFLTNCQIKVCVVLLELCVRPSLSGLSSVLGREPNHEGDPKYVDGVCRQPGNAHVVLPPQRHLMQHQVTLSLARDGQQVGHICVIRDYYY